MWYNARQHLLSVFSVVFLARICSAGATTEPLVYQVKVDGRDVPIYSETVAFGQGQSKGDDSFAGPYFFGEIGRAHV